MSVLNYVYQEDHGGPRASRCAFYSVALDIFSECKRHPYLDHGTQSSESMVRENRNHSPAYLSGRVASLLSVAWLLDTNGDVREDLCRRSWRGKFDESSSD